MSVGSELSSTTHESSTRNALPKIGSPPVCPSPPQDFSEKSPSVLPPSRAYVEATTIDAVLETIGAFGRSQQRQTLLCGLVWMLFGMTMMQSVFTCLHTGDLVQAWQLTPNEAGLLKSSVFAGTVLGTPLFGKLSDTYGRRKALILGVALSGIWCALGALASTFWAFLLCCLFVGVFGSGIGLVAFVLASETWGSSLRTTLANGTHLTFTVGIIGLTLFALILGPSQRLLVVVSLLHVAVLWFLIQHLDESPRWLYSSGTPALSESLIRQMAEINGRPLPESWELQPLQTAQESTNEANLLCTNALLRRCTCLLCALWFAASFSYYGISMDAENIGSSVYATSLWLALVEIPGFLVPIVAFRRLGRTKGGCLVFSLVALACFSVGFQQRGSAFQVILALFGKFASCGCFASVYMLSTELLPTSVRTFGSGINSAFARLAATMAPLVVSLFSPWGTGAPFVVFGLVSVAAALLSLQLRDSIDVHTGIVTTSETVADFCRMEESWLTQWGGAVRGFPRSHSKGPRHVRLQVGEMFYDEEMEGDDVELPRVTQRTTCAVDPTPHPHQRAHEHSLTTTLGKPVDAVT